MNSSRIYNQFHRIGILEGISYLLLLGVAMPLKYIWDMPLAVKYTGWAHGFLFMLYLLWALRCYIALKWPFKELFLAGVASVLPFGPFWFHRRLEQQKPIDNAYRTDGQV
jgi:integral membrane protein